VEFYEKAFGLARGFVHESGEFGELKTGQTTLAFASLTLAPANVEGVSPLRISSGRPPPSRSRFRLTMSVLHLLVRQQQARLRPAAQSETVGQTVAYVRDLNGNLVELCTPMT
jgi:lactoylglutathione lyase